MHARSVSAARSELLPSRASQMRAVPTASERLLWEALRGGRLGVTFRRQVPLDGRFIADFLAPAAKLVVEVDGGYHDARGRADARRDAALRKLGYRVLRIEAVLVERDIEAAVAMVREAVAEVR